jgi:hypothetical protein
MNLYLLGCFSAGNTDQFQYMHTLFYLQALFKRTKDLVGLPNIDSDGSLSLMVIVIKKNDEHVTNKIRRQNELGPIAFCK